MNIFYKIDFILLDRILAINTNKGYKRAFKINPLGGYEVLKFEFGKDTEVHGSCSVQWQNQHYVFGGQNQKRQVSLIIDNRLELKGTLDYTPDSLLACTVLNQVSIVLCFGESGKRNLCRQSKNPLEPFTKLPTSTYDHSYIRLASFGG